MKKSSALLALLLVFLSIPAFAQRAGRGRYANPSRQYDVKTVTTIDGTVTSVENPSSRNGRFNGTHLVVSTGTSSVNVHLGPSWYMQEKGFSFKTGDKVQVTGSRISQAGTTAIVAQRITKDGSTLQLRDENGIPAWSGRGGRR